MTRYNCWILLIALCCRCTPSMYQVVTAGTYQNAAAQPNQRKLIYISALNLPDEANWVTIINKRKWAMFNKQIGLVSDNASREFLHSVKHLVNNDYAASYQVLGHLPETSFDCQVLMLKTDCRYQLKDPSVDFKNDYQRALDCAGSPQVKAILKTRYRFVNYGY